MADNDLPWQSQTGMDEPMLAVAMGGLVQVHEVHVDLGPWQVLIELRGEMEKRLTKLEEACDPHLGGGEGMAPGDDAGAVGIAVGLEHHGANLLGTGQDRLEDQLERKPTRGVELINDTLGVGGDLAQGTLAIQVLRAGEEPDFGSGDVFHGKSKGGIDGT